MDKAHKIQGQQAESPKKEYFKPVKIKYFYKKASYGVNDGLGRCQSGFAATVGTRGQYDSG